MQLICCKNADFFFKTLLPLFLAMTGRGLNVGEPQPVLRGGGLSSLSSLVLSCLLSEQVLASRGSNIFPSISRRLVGCAFIYLVLIVPQLRVSCKPRHIFFKAIKISYSTCLVIYCDTTESIVSLAHFPLSLT
jgi:hypothetical protein